MRLGLFLLACALVAGGCRRRSSAPPPEPVTSVEAQSTAPTAPSAATPEVRATQPLPTPGTEPVTDKLPTAPPNASRTNPADVPLTEALHRFFEANNRLPADFSELVRAKFIPAMPNPPAGKRYAIDRPNMQVVLINQ